ncbi:hypothetical protein G3576_22105 [Roseomonas stagni]|uniref:DUF3592 domain-containing protein n=1 Tax=Falsiroseomonas algicola TaxID=2716930 RepID=A0A6M1LRS3_9PROT|nr:hypothetical protein [Falsiroseomonas algicola]
MQTNPAPVAPPPAPRRSWGDVLKSLLGLLMFGGLTIALGVYTLPNLVSDWQVRGSAMPYADARVTQGSCSSKVFVHICNATLSVQSKSGRYTREVNYVFADFHTGAYTVAVMADPARPEMLTTDLALDTLWNRTVTAAVAGLLLVGLTLGSLLGLLRG